jgi:hypothetical protein
MNIIRITRKRIDDLSLYDYYEVDPEIGGHTQPITVHKADEDNPTISWSSLGCVDPETARKYADAIATAAALADRPLFDHENCGASTTIGGETSFGQGKLDEYGFWEIPCQECAREHERKYGLPVNSCWPHTSK